MSVTSPAHPNSRPRSASLAWGKSPIDARTPEVWAQIQQETADITLEKLFDDVVAHMM